MGGPNLISLVGKFCNSLFYIIFYLKIVHPHDICLTQCKTGRHGLELGVCKANTGGLEPDPHLGDVWQIGVKAEYLIRQQESKSDLIKKHIFDYSIKIQFKIISPNLTRVQRYMLQN